MRGRKPIHPITRWPNRIRELRLAEGMSQQRLGELVGMSYQQVGKYERGALRLKADQLSAFGRAFRCESWELLSDSPTISAQQRVLLDLFERLSAEDRLRLIRLGDALAEQTGDEENQQAKNIS